MNYLTALFADGRKPDDWLSPILVKELRQGMRARVFVISFLLLQVFLVVLVLGNLVAQDDRGTLDFQNHIFWIIIGFALLALMPLRGLVTVSGEIKNHTLETIMLTRLTAWRVVFGKWSALFAQSLLLVSAVLPYVVLRYFIGGDDVVSDFEWILFMLWLSAILIAASIAVSALGNPVIRVILLVGIVVLAASGTGDIFWSGTALGEAWEILGWLLIFGFFIPALLFELTASGIAPASENHAIRRRLLALLFFATASGLAWITHSDFTPGVATPLIVLIGVCYFDLSEKPRLLPRMIQSLAQKGWLGKFAAFFFLPGWPSALLFSLAVIPAATALIWPTLTSSTSPDVFALPLMLTSIGGSVLTPILICHLFWPKMNQVLLMVFLYNIVLLGLASVIEGFATLMHSNMNDILFFIPGLPVSMTSAWTGDNASLSAWYAIGNAITLNFLVIILLASSRRYHRDLIALFRSANSPQTSPVGPESGQAAS